MRSDNQAGKAGNTWMEEKKAGAEHFQKVTPKIRQLP